MTQKYSYHTHTTFSDGKSFAESMIKKAKELGWTQIGVSDHLTVHKNIKNLPDYNFSAYKKGPVKGVFLNQSFAEIRDETKRHFDELDRLAKKYDIEVLKGFEVDYFTYDGWEEELKEFIREHPTDYLLNGNHFFSNESGDQILDVYYLKHHSAPTGKELEAYMQRHYKTIEQAIESGLFDFVAHLDYSRAISNSIDMFKDEKISVIKKLAEHGVATELSTKGIRRQNNPYPAPWLLDVAKEHNVCIVISDDAHSDAELGADFSLAEEMLQGYQNRLILGKKQY